MSQAALGYMIEQENYCPYCGKGYVEVKMPVSIENPLGNGYLGCIGECAYYEVYCRHPRRGAGRGK